MRILLWHGWLLEGSGSNVHTARTAETFRAAGHDVLVLSQEAHPERYGWIDFFGFIDGNGPGTLTPGARNSHRSGGRCLLLRPRIGSLLPVFVLDRYEGFEEVRRFVDLTDEQLATYLARNVDALRAAVEWHGSDAVFVGHAIPGAAIGKRALGPARYVAKIHGSDIEYAIRLQDRYLDLAREGLRSARAVVGSTLDVLKRATSLVPEIGRTARAVPPGVEAKTFRPRHRREALVETAERLHRDPAPSRGRPASTDALVAEALARRDARALDELADTYDQEVPDPDAATRLTSLATSDRSLVGYLGKLIPQKGVHLLLAAHHASRPSSDCMVVGFGSHREWLSALAIALREPAGGPLGWLQEIGGMPLGPLPARSRGARDTSDPVIFTGRLDHRYAPGALAAMDVLVIPSILEEAFGMVAAEGAAAGALPLVAAHSGLAEVASVLEQEVGRPGLFSFRPGPGGVGRIASGIGRLLELPPAERRELRRHLSSFVAAEWSWERTCTLLLSAAAVD